MATARMKYGTGHVDVTVPDENLAGVIGKQLPSSALSEEDAVRKSLESPVGSPRLRDMVKPGRKVCVVVPDVTRLWQRVPVYLPHVIAEINAGGVDDSGITLLSAIGYHRPQTPEEHLKIIGPEMNARFKLLDHDCEDESMLVAVGTTSRGVPVKINRLAMEADHMVLTGGCCYHPFVGWGGGKKALVPGIAGFDTIQKNHYMVLSEALGGGQRSECRNGNFENNPLHEDMMEAAEMVQPSFLFNVIMGYDGKIAAAVSGHWRKAHEHGCRIVEDMYGVRIEGLADLTIASQGGFPKDINFYQTGKAIYHAADSVRPGGTLIILSECREGLGPEDAELIFKGFGTNAEREQEVRRLFTVPKYVCYYMCSTADKYDVIVVSSMDPALASRTSIRIVKTVGEALELAYAKLGRNPRTYLMPLGSSVLPIPGRN